MGQTFGKLVFLGLSANLCSAWMVKELPPTELIEQSCRLILDLPSEKLPNNIIRTHQVLCSGTIIGKTKLLSAAHCFAGKTITGGRILCPNSEPRKIENWAVPDKFPSNGDGSIDCEHMKQDFSVVTVTSAFDADPIRMAKDEAEATNLTTQKPDCRIFGYGLDEHNKTGTHNGRKGVFGKWLISTLVETWTNAKGEVTKRVETPQFAPLGQCDTFQVLGSFTPDATVETPKPKEESAIRHGDSGGGLVCKDEAGELVLVGVTSGNSEMDGKPIADSVSVGKQRALINQLLQRSNESLPAHQNQKSENERHAE